MPYQLFILFLGENISYLVPRDPSIMSWDDRVQLPVPCTKNLIQLGADYFEETMGDKIKVYLRLKPSLSQNNIMGSFNTYTILSSTILQTEAPKDSVSYKNVANGVGKLIHKFTFSSILNQETSQAALFKKCAMTSLNKFIAGENFLLMAYGTTSAGKTYTMQGNVDQPGVIPRALDFVFSGLKENIIPICRYQPHQYNEFILLTEEQLQKDLAHKNFILSLDLTKNQRYPDASTVTLQTTASSGFSDAYENMTFKEMQSHLADTDILDINSNMFKYGVWISMIEIYNEQVYDLLEIPSSKNEPRSKLMFRDDELGNTFVKNLRYVNVCSGHEAFQILQFGRSNLHLAPTALNLSSSRSHCIFTITLAKFFDYNSTSSAVMSRYSFCDLAGMERAKKTLNVKDRLVESKAINTSLSILVKCLTTIKENQNNREKKMIPYRESKLTKLFRDAVTGKEQFSLIVNVTTEPNLFDETISVLKFSAIAQKIVPQHVFIKPKVRKSIKKSRFSQIVENCSYNSKSIDWDASTMADNSSAKEIFESKYTSELHELRELVQRLKEELERERKRGEQIEIDIREELTSEFSEILRKQSECSRLRLESEVGTLEEMHKRKEKRIVQYYEHLRKRENMKRRKPEDEDEEYDLEKCEEKLKEVESALKSATSTNECLKEQLQKLTEEHNKALTECSELRFIIVERDRILEDLRRANQAKDAGGDSLEMELKKQLEEAKHKISLFKNLLDEAAADHKELEENNTYLTRENEVLEQNLAEDREKVEDLTNENFRLQKMLSHKNLLIEKLEEANDKLREELTVSTAGENFEEELKEKISELKKLKDELEKKAKELEEIQSQFEAVMSENSSLESDVEIYRIKVVDLQNKIVNMEQSVDNKKELELEAKISELNEEINRLREDQLQIETLIEEKRTLEEKCRELSSEIHALQSEIKNLVLQTHKAGEVESLKMVNEMLVNELSEVKGQKDELEEKVHELAEDLKNKKILVDELLDVKEKKKELEKEVFELMKELDNKKREIEDVNSLFKEKEEKIEYLYCELENNKKEMENFSQTILLLQNKNEELLKEFDEKDELVKNLKENQRILFNNHKEEIINLKEKNEELQKNVIISAELSTLEKNFTPEDMIENMNECENHGNMERMLKVDEEKKTLAEAEDERDTERNDKIEDSHKNSENLTPEKLAKQIENMSLKAKTKSVRKKVDCLDESVHPSTIKKSARGRKKKGDEENLPKSEAEGDGTKKKGKCYKQLFLKNDFDSLSDLSTSATELEIPRLRPRK